MNESLNGLILCGGFSKRMQTDKAFLVHDGQTFLERTAQLLEPYCRQVFLSIRKDQIEEPRFLGYQRIVDHPYWGQKGPISGIISAMKAYPENSWIVVAVDLPKLPSAALKKLTLSRDPLKLATAFRSTDSARMPEPLCAVYEYEALSPLEQWMEEKGQTCPRKFLMNHDVKLIDQDQDDWLMNVNTPNDFNRL
ncbi:MAG: NTP transferase domain-containing protein [Candidatus Omnitrophica bacterium]|nr:NTP transferase domain-containing protein [Candidatus Omnitrophota bacterium]